jgi:hypothetical protein
MTTATLREQARSAEENLEWDHACFLYEKAVAEYPTGTGDLARKDIASLQIKADRCRLRAALADLGEED